MPQKCPICEKALLPGDQIVAALNDGSEFSLYHLRRKTDLPEEECGVHTDRGPLDVGMANSEFVIWCSDFGYKLLPVEAKLPTVDFES